MSNHQSPRQQNIDGIAVALVFIAVGVLLLARNIGIINYSIYHFLVSWKMLLIVLGLVQIIKQKLIPGAILIAIGGYFMLPDLPWWPGHTIRTFWPLLFILCGGLILISRTNIIKKKKYNPNQQTKNIYSSEDGFVVAEVAFGSNHQVVFDPYFKGAKLTNSFGSIVLDLRKTNLYYPETFIEVECTFGGIEVYVPIHWQVIIDTDTTLSGCSDKRHYTHVDIDNTHKLIIKGDITFSGLEIKN